MLESQVVYIPEKENISKLVTDQSFMGAILDWLTKTPMGIGVFVFSLIFLFLLLIFCAWRIFRAPENRDGLVSINGTFA
jgi:cell shape-determining protein MreD